MYFSKGNRTPLCPSSPPLAAAMQAIKGMGVGWQIGRDIELMGGLGGTICSSGDILLFVLEDGARGEEGSHMVGIYQPLTARVIECELKVKQQTAERESRARGSGSGTRLFIISLKGRSAVQWITLTTKLTACSLSALWRFAAVLSVQLKPNPLHVPAWDALDESGQLALWRTIPLVQKPMIEHRKTMKRLSIRRPTPHSAERSEGKPANPMEHKIFIHLFNLYTSHQDLTKHKGGTYTGDAESKALAQDTVKCAKYEKSNAPCKVTMCTEIKSMWEKEAGEREKDLLLLSNLYYLF